MHRFMLGRNSCRLFYSTKTFANQSLLQPLPIPELEATGERYKRSLIPLLNKREHQRACITIDQFTRGDFGKQLQARLYRLSEKEAKEGRSWLSRLWKEKTYLGVRSSNIYSNNWWLPLRGSTNQVKDNGKATAVQLDQAARIVAGLLNYSNQINREQIEPDSTPTGPLCMDQLKHLFGTTRIPDLPVDKSISQYPATAKHIMVTYKNQLFSVQMISGVDVSIQAIKRQLEEVVKQVEATGETELELPIGLFTTEIRDTWAKIRKSLETNPRNAYNFNEIDTSLFILCLDHYTSSGNSETKHLNYAHGRYGYNRWFDKCVQVIVDTSGAMGFNFEHSTADGIIPIQMAKDVLKLGVYVNDAPPLSPPRPLKWTINDLNTIKKDLQAAEINAKRLVDDLQCETLTFTNYGSELMKLNKISPDGWIQMAIQLAYYRLHGHPCPSYEITATRRFLTGRSDIIRTCTEESVAFTNTWDDKNIPITIKLAYLERALASHKEYLTAVSQGHGIDAHLFGLYHQMTPEEALSEHAALFQDPIYNDSQNWTMCTSNVTLGHGEHSYFPPMIPDGYAICYVIKPEKILFTMSAFRHSPETDLVALRDLLVDTLSEFAETITYYNELSAKAVG